MEEHPFTPPEKDKALIERIEAETPFRRMPAPADLPVVVAARMSLSFPTLISAVPLHAIVWKRKKEQKGQELPLKKGQQPDPDERENVWFPSKTGEAVQPTWTPITGLFGFLGTILNPMQNWSDNTQMRLPGYRDRVAHVFLAQEEGGMNLSMPKERVERFIPAGSKSSSQPTIRRRAGISARTLGRSTPWRRRQD